jgi:hypothetical protein
MRLAILWLATTLAAQAEFVRVAVTFQGTDCISCTESLQGRLERVRGVESVALDLERSIVTMGLEAENKVRLAPLLSRITQDGTKISRIEIVAKGAIMREEGKLRFQPAGLKETYRLQLLAEDSKRELQQDSLYEIRGTVLDFEPGADAVIEAVSATPVSATPAR